LFSYFSPALPQLFFNVPFNPMPSYQANRPSFFYSALSLVFSLPFRRVLFFDSAAYFSGFVIISVFISLHRIRDCLGFAFYALVFVVPL